MEIGNDRWMMWLMKEETVEQIELGLEYFRRKYGTHPVAIMLPKGCALKVGGVAVTNSETVLPLHVYIGLGKDNS